MGGEGDGKGGEGESRGGSDLQLSLRDATGINSIMIPKRKFFENPF